VWARTAFDGLMTIYGSCQRAGYKQQLTEVGLAELRGGLARRYAELDARYRNDAINQGKAIISSQRKLLPRRLSEVEAKINQTERKLGRTKDALRRQGIMVRLDRLGHKRRELITHLEENTIPKVIFGGRHNFEQRLRGQITREEWQGLRANRFYSRGEKNKQGNLHTRLRYDEDTEQFYLRVGFPQKNGRCRYEWFPLQVPSKDQYRDLLSTASKGQEAYSVEVLRRDGRYYAHITVEENTPGRIVQHIQAERVGGIDLNLDQVAVGVSDRQGQYRGSWVYRCEKLAYASHNKRDWVIGNLAREIVADLIAQGIEALVLEQLDIKQTHDTNTRYNRRTVNFTHRRLHEAILREALRVGLQVKLVNPAYSSVMGRLKYAGPYGLSDHQAAAYVLARRGLGMKERLPKSLIKVLPVLVEELDDLIPSLTAEWHERAVRWRERLVNWHQYSPQESKHPWLLWVTIDSVY
jgi:IS605 OrfB family transposase